MVKKISLYSLFSILVQIGLDGTKIRKIIGIINLFPNFVTLIVETNTLTYMRDLTITAIIKVYQYDELNEGDRSL